MPQTSTVVGSQVRGVCSSLAVTLPLWTLLATSGSAQLFWSLEDVELNQPRPALVIVTDRAGTKHSLSTLGSGLSARPPHFVYADSNWQEDRVFSVAERNQLEVVQNASPRRSIWIHYSQIKLAFITTAGSARRVEITLDDGQSVTGTLAPELEGFKGAGSLGEATIQIGDIRTVEFSDFESRTGNRMPRQALAAIWRTAHEKAALRCRATILDGDRRISDRSFFIRDSYRTNWAGAFVYSGPVVRTSSRLTDVMVKIGVAETKIMVSDLAAIEISGKIVDGSPEVVLTKRDGMSIAAQLLTINETRYRGSDVYGPPGPEDLLAWFTPEGFESVSLIPVRRILIQFQEPCNR
jgi:hypothetical protein